MLFRVRTGEKQYVYFYAKEAGLFYNTEDSSRAILERTPQHLTQMLAATPEYAINR
jgi:hypothetical protein